MRNRRFIFSVFASGTMLALTAVACEDDKPSEFVDPKLQDTGAPDRLTFNVDGATPPDAGTAVSCNPTLPGNFAPEWKPPVKEAACTEAEINEYFDACLDVDKGKALDSQSCKDFLAAKASCVTCIERKDNTGPVRTYRDRFYYEQNYPHCVALLQAERGGTDACGKAFFEYEECTRQSCDGCFDFESATFKDYTACVDKASQSGECKRRGEVFDDNCAEKGYKDASAGGAPECFIGGGRKAFFINLIKLTCLKP